MKRLHKQPGAGCPAVFSVGVVSVASGNVLASVPATYRYTLTDPSAVCCFDTARWMEVGAGAAELAKVGKSIVKSGAVQLLFTVESHGAIGLVGALFSHRLCIR